VDADPYAAVAGGVNPDLIGSTALTIRTTSAQSGPLSLLYLDCRPK